jgi:hypothetical protein
VAKHVVETMVPGLVRVSANIHTLCKFKFSGLGILHVKIDVENEIADFLNSSPRRPLRTNPVREVALTRVAVPDPRAGGDFLLKFRRNADEAEAPRGAKLSRRRRPAFAAVPPRLVWSALAMC